MSCPLNCEVRRLLDTQSHIFHCSKLISDRNELDDHSDTKHEHIMGTLEQQKKVIMHYMQLWDRREDMIEKHMRIKHNHSNHCTITP